MWPFTRNSEEKKYDLLIPLSRFYNLLNITGILIIWTLVVFMWAITYTYFTTFSSTSISTLVIIVLVWGFVSSPWIIIWIHLFYRIYMNTIKSVFSKAYYPDKYMKIDDKLNNSIERPVPVDCNASSEKSQELMSVNQQKEDKASNFEFEGGEDSKYLEEEKEYSHEPLPPIKVNSILNSIWRGNWN